MAYESAVAALSPKLFYKLDESSGSSAVDYGSLGVNGTYSGTPTRSQDPLYFGGSASSRHAAGNNAYVSISTSDPQTYTAFTVCGWWKATDQTTDPFLMMMGWSGGSSIPVGIGTNTGSTHFIAGTFDNSSWHYVTGTTTIVSGGTYFVAATLSAKSSGTLTLYVNGVSEGTPQTGLTVGNWTVSTIYIGHQWDSGYMSTGTYGGWAMFNSALSAGQISSLYASGLVPRQNAMNQPAVRRSVPVQHRSRRF